MIKVFSRSQLPTGHMHQFSVGEYDVLLANVAGEIYAIQNKCSHYGAPLSKGALCEHRVRCPWHHASFDLRTGEQIEAPGMDGVPRFEVRVEGDDIFVSPEPVTDNTINFPSPKPRIGAARDHYDYVIVGGGPAGAYAVEAIRAADSEGSLLLISAEDLPPYDRTKVSKNYLQEDSASQLPLRSEEFYARLNVHFMAGTRVEKLDLHAKSLQLADARTIRYERVLMASGSTPVSLDIPGADLGNVFPIRTAKDAEAARAAVTEGTKVVIVGGSFIGLETAMSLGKRGADITVVTREEVLFEKPFGVPTGRYIQHLHEAAGVKFRLGTQSRAFTGDEKVSGVELEDGTTLEAEVVIVGIGVKPNTDYISGIAYQDDRSLAVDGHLAVHAEDAWAAGDIATYPDREGMVRIEHWKVAGQQGRIAGRNMAGTAAPYTMVPYFWTNQQGVNFRYVGHGTDYDEIVYDGKPGEAPFLAFYIKDRHVQACLGVKRDAEVAAINELLALGRMPAVEHLTGQDWLARCREV